MTPRLRRTIPALWSLLLWCTGAQAAAVPNARPMIVEHLSTLDGLPQGTVYTTLHDSRGFVWFGTEDGLVRYDGHETHRYAYSPKQPAGLPGNFIFAIAEDANSDLWLATKGAGLARWNRASDTFTVFKHDEKNPQSLASDSLRTVCIDSQGRIWIGTLGAGVDVLDPVSGRALHLRQGSEGLINDRVYSLLETERGEMWIGTEAGLDRWRLDVDRFVHIPFPGGHVALEGKQIAATIKSRDGSVWAGTHESGVRHLSAAGQELLNLHHNQNDAGSIVSDEVHSLYDDQAGHIWIGTAAGLDALSTPALDISHYAHDKSDPDSLSDSFIMSLYEDDAGLMWIGTRSGGVNRWNSHSWELGGRNPAWLEGRWVVSFADAPDGHVWLGTMGGGLYNFNPDTGDAVNLDTLLHKDNALGDRRIMSLHQDRRGNLWIGTWANGVERMSPDGQITAIGAKPGDPHSLSAPGVAAIYEANNGTLWIGTHGGGANILDPTTGIVRQLPAGTETAGATSSKNITSFIEDAAGNVWMGTEDGGLDVADAQGSVLRAYKHDAANSASLSSNIVYALELDSNGALWAATDGGGLDAVVGSSSHPNDVKFQAYSQAEGLTSDTIYAVLRDAAGQLWLSGNAGLMRFDPVTHAVKTYHREHGLQGEEFSSGAYFRTQNGRLCFGGAGGFNVFDPRLLAQTSQPPGIALTGIEVLGAPVHEATPNWLLQRVNLDYRASVVSFDFAALDFTSPRRNRLAYRVSQLTDKWIDLNSQRRVTLTNLPAGDHVLEVRAANADSVWSTVPYRLTIHKSAAPWASSTAYAVYALLGICLTLWAVRSQRAKLRGALAAQQQLESEVALRTKELREANQQLFIAGEAKSQFLARMGHELRTPMNGVVGMTELIARSPLSVAQARQIQTIRTSAKTLLQILNDLLDLSKAQAGKTVLESLPLDLNLLMEECVAMFIGAAESKGIDLIVCPALPVGLDPVGDPLRVRQLLMNLVGNAVKFTEHGEVVVACDLKATGPQQVRVSFTVRDTGVGISESALEKIFEPFTQADETTTRRFGGTGLGLSICHELARLMQGDIAVQSEIGKGSTFTATITLGAHARASAAVSVPGDGVLLVVSRRPSFCESWRRHAELNELTSREATLDGLAAVEPHDIVILDADSCPEGIARCMDNGFRNRIIVVAAPATVERRQLEAMIPNEQLLRSPLQQDAISQAIAACKAAANCIEGADTKNPSDDATGAFLFPLLSAHVLIVEDDEVNGAVAEGYLSMLRCSSVWLKDGLSAVSRCERERFDLILMDLNMPGLDGYETTRRIRAHEKPPLRTPIIALTANKASAYRESCLLAGMDDILTKPCSLAELTQLLRCFVDKTGKQRRANPPSDAPRNLTVVDSAGVARLGNLSTEANATLFPRLVALFERSAVDALARIEVALRTQEWEVARQAAHKLKGAAGNVGAYEFAAQLAELEESCTRADAAVSHHCNRLLRAALPSLLDTLKSNSLEASA